MPVKSKLLFGNTAVQNFVCGNTSSAERCDSLGLSGDQDVRLTEPFRDLDIRRIVAIYQGLGWTGRVTMPEYESNVESLQLQDMRAAAAPRPNHV